MIYTGYPNISVSAQGVEILKTIYENTTSFYDSKCTEVSEYANQVSKLSLEIPNKNVVERHLRVEMTNVTHQMITDVVDDAVSINDSIGLGWFMSGVVQIASLPIPE